MSNFQLNIDGEEPLFGSLKLESGLLRIKHDYEIPFALVPYQRQRILSKLVDWGLPETVKTLYDVFTPLTEMWGDYWMRLLRLFNPNMSILDFETAWNSLIKHDRAFTNKKEGIDLAIESLICGGATVKSVSPNVIVKYGFEWKEVYCLNGVKNPPPLPEKADNVDMTLHFLATIIRPDILPDGTYRIIPFPQFSNTIVPFVSDHDTNFIRVDRLKSVDSIISPFNPP